MPEQIDPEHYEQADLLAAVNTLSLKVEALTTANTVSIEQARKTAELARKTRRNTRVGFIVIMLFICAGIFNSARINHLVEDNASNAVQVCENGNETRAANRALWTTIIGLSAADPASTPESKAVLAALLEWITTGVYVDHDCGDLGREYVIPDPPDFTAL